MKSLLTVLLVVLKLTLSQAKDPWTSKNDSLLRIVSHSDVDSVKAHAYSQLKEIWQTQNFRKAVEYGHQALYHAKKSGKKEQIVGIMFQLAWAYMSIGNAAASIDILQQIIPLTKNHNLDQHGTALSFIAMNYVVLKDYHNALKYMREATILEAAMNAQGKYLGQISYLGSRLNMAIVFVGKSQTDSALHYGKIAFQRLKNEKLILPESQHFLWNIPWIYGDAHRIAKRNNTAMQLYREALHHATKQNHQTGIPSIKLSLAHLFEQIKAPDSSLMYAHQALISFEKSHDYPQLSDAGLLLYQLYKRKNNTVKALHFFEICMAARDSVMNRDKILAVQYLTDKQERQKREIEIENEQEQARQWQYGLLIGLMVFLIIALIVYRNYRQQKRLNTEIEALNEGLEYKVEQRAAELKTALNEVQTAFDKGQTTERKRVSADLHDEIGSALSTIAIFSDVTIRKAQKTAPELVNELEKIGAKSREMVQTMRDTIWTLNEDSSQNLWERMYQYGLETLTAQEISLDWQVPDDAPNNLPFASKRNLFLAFKEAMHNIMKHAQATKVSLDLQIGIHDLLLNISDNGKGFDIEMARNEGNGLQNFEKRLAEIGGTVQIRSEIGKGTKLIFFLPLSN